MVRRLKSTESKSTTERVAEHRERLKEAGIKRLDLSVSTEAYESLLAWSKAQKLSYSEAAEQLFLAASAPVEYYTSSCILNNEKQFVSQQNVSGSLNGFSNSSTILTPQTSVVEAFFKSQINNNKENDDDKKED